MNDAQLKKQVENIYDALNDKDVQEKLATQFMDVFNSVKPELKSELSERVFEVKARCQITIRASKALLFLAMQDL